MNKSGLSEAWIKKVEEALGENANPPVQLKKLFGGPNILDEKTENLDFLLKQLLKANVEYDLELYIRTVSYEIEKRMQQVAHKENRCLAIVAIIIASLSALFQIIEFFTCK